MIEVVFKHFVIVCLKYFKNRFVEMFLRQIKKRELLLNLTVLKLLNRLK